MKEVFTPKAVNWLLAIIFGIALPVVGQSFIAEMVSSLNTLPTYVNGEIVQPGDPTPAMIGLSILFIVYILVFAYQILFIAKLKTHSSVWALTITVACPLVISVALPSILGFV